MLLRWPSIVRRGVERVKKDEWIAKGDDPQFLYFTSAPFLTHLVFEISDADRLLDPRIYIDSGEGLQPDEEIELRSVRHGICSVALRSFGRVRRLRFDPASFPASFKLRAFAAFDEVEVTGFVGRRMREAAKEGRDLPLCETIVGKSPPSEPGRRGKGARKIRGISQQYDQIIGMAEARYCNAPPWPEDAPAISFIAPVYNAPVRYLDQLLGSFRIQKRGAFELILSDDGSTSRDTRDWLDRHEGADSLKIIRNASNAGIAAATNLGIAAAVGEWIGLVDHDDALAPFAVDRLLETIAAGGGAQFIYTDEVVTGADLDPQVFFFKPAFDPVLLSGVNYVNHLSLYRRSRLEQIGGMRIGFDGSQDYDLLLRYTKGLTAEEILHLPYPAYLWRRDGDSFSTNFLDSATDRARRALAEAYAKDGAAAQVEPALDKNLHRVRFDASTTSWPLVSVVIPSRDAFPLISRLLDDLTRRTDYPNIEILVVDNGSTDQRVLDLYEKMRRENPAFRAEIVVEPFNFARQVNRGLRAATGEHVLLLNNDIEVIRPGWLKEMVSCGAYPDVGVVGARLLYPDGSLQHAGVIAGLGTVAGHWFCGQPTTAPGPMNRLTVRNSFAAVTGACMLISRPCLRETGYFDEENFAIAYNDIDFCLRAGREGFRVVWTPFATLCHHKSASRGSDETDANIARFRREQESLRSKYDLLDFIDPAFSPFYSRHHGLPRNIVPATLPEQRVFRV